jgi:excisionase family DNA binding protein
VETATRPLTLSPAEVARLLSVTEPVVRGWIARDRIPVIRFGNRLLIPRQGLESALKAAGLPSADLGAH